MQDQVLNVFRHVRTRLPHSAPHSSHSSNRITSPRIPQHSLRITVTPLTAPLSSRTTPRITPLQLHASSQCDLSTASATLPTPKCRTPGPRGRNSARRSRLLGQPLPVIAPSIHAPTPSDTATEGTSDPASQTGSAADGASGNEIESGGISNKSLRPHRGLR